MFSFIKDKLKKIYSTVTSQINQLFQYKKIDEATLTELESILISADTGMKTTKIIIDQLRTQILAGNIIQGGDLKRALEAQLIALLQTQAPPSNPSIYLLVGINGSGKTTFAAKLAHKFQQEGKRVMLVAADTFRAAAVEQLTQWASTLQIPLVVGKPGQDPAAVVFQGCERFKAEQADILIVDTAGRLQTKTNLMRELEKIKKTMNKILPERQITTLLTIDAMLGQNSFEQARLFNESTQVQGVILTKMDGTGKGGIVFAITQELKIPIVYVSYGEHVDAVKFFDAQEYVADLLGK